MFFPKHDICFTLNRNPHLDTHDHQKRSVQLYLEERMDMRGETDLISSLFNNNVKQQELAIETDRMWEAIWYPNTPVGSYNAAAATLESLMVTISDPEYADGVEAPAIDASSLLTKLTFDHLWFTLDHNDHKGVYQSAGLWIHEQRNNRTFHWPSYPREAEWKLRMTHNDDIWSLAWCGTTSRRLHRIAAPTLNELLDFAATI